MVGCVKGIGLALFAFMRMRSGADVIKPDIRVKKAMVSLGFVVSNDDHALLVLAKAAAQEIGAFAAVERVGCYRKAQVSGLKALAMEDGDRDYCGRTADASLLRVVSIASTQPNSVATTATRQCSVRKFSPAASQSGSQLDRERTAHDRRASRPGGSRSQPG